MKPFRDDAELIAELRALRPAPQPAFAAELDERAAAGFPRRSPIAESPLAGAAAWLRAASSRRLFFSSGAAALAAIALATVVVLGNETGPAAPSRDRTAHTKTGQAEWNTGLIPSSRSVPSQTPNSYGYVSKPEAAEAEAIGGAAKNLAGESSAASDAVVPEKLTAGGAFAEGAAHRDVEHSAEVVLGADPADVADDSAAVFDAVHAANGIVLHSSTVEGSAGKAHAEFDLLIPSAKLADALAAFSGIDEVRSRHEATADITAPTVDIGEHLQDSRARIDGLLAQLSGAETESEREIVEAELDAERHRGASLRSRLANLHRRTSFSRLSLRIETGASSSTDEGGAWGIGDAFHDAGHILAIAAAVVLVALAVLGPIALIALLAWLAQRAWVRRERQRALS
jgi:Domain of unknown function (DUF4349)